MPLSAYETVLGETPARRATSVIFTIGRPRLALSVGLESGFEALRPVKVCAGRGAVNGVRGNR
ncbi:hypothetical protein GCM10010247_34220 [Streptomyces calvus]|nr:hypothetical protein GCM10010247_34220 [Streptomyces calvus]